MILTVDQVKEIALSAVDKKIEIARKDAVKLRLHYYGEGLDAHLAIVDGLESQEQLKLRKKFGISARFLTENMLRPLDNIWSAKGGGLTVEVSGKSAADSTAEFLDLTKQIGGGFTINDWMQSVWRDLLITDPMGLQFLEVSETGDTAYLTFKRIDTIKNMELNGIVPKYVCFEPHESNDDYKVLWLVDDAKYYEVKIKGDNATILSEITNTFERVPGCINSTIFDTRREIFISPIWSQVELLDKYVNNMSVNEIYIQKHGFPIFWMYSMPCKKCNGTGYIDGHECSNCDGTGHTAKKDVTDIIALRVPDNDAQRVAPDIAGYVQPDLNAWTQYREELDWTEDKIFFSHWGTSQERSENETATGRFIDVQPVTLRLNMYADIAQMVHNILGNLSGKFFMPASFEKYSRRYGRRYMIETPDQIWKKYTDARTAKANVAALNSLLLQYYESEYKNDSVSLIYYTKLMKIEPMVHNSIDEVLSMTGISQQTINDKIYFSDWLQSIDEQEIINQEDSKLRELLSEYSQSKQTQ